MAKSRECPFCGADTVEVLEFAVGERYEYVASCVGCHARGAPADYDNEAITNWNARLLPTPCPREP